MKHETDNQVPVRDDRWLRREVPEAYYMLRAVEGDVGAFDWLREKSRALLLFTQAVAGDREAAAFGPGHDLDLDDLFGMICHLDLGHYLGENHPELHLLFEAIKGDEGALRRLKRKKACLGRLAEAVQPLYRGYQCAEQDDPPDPEPNAATPEIPEEAAADVGCLIGELHLSKGDYEKAVEAFTRSLEGEPTADAYAGRARAYRGLAERDERRAQELRARTAAPDAV
jgi:tetratricopeptide (TPR) repeat protein